MPSCIVPFCRNTEKVPGITFHQLGKSRYAPWLEAIGRSPSENLSSLNSVCSIHFEATEFIKHGTNVILRKGAIPKLFLPKNAKHKQTTPQNIPDDDVFQIPSTSKSSPKQSGIITGSSSDSEGLRGVQKRNRRLVKRFHNYATTPDSYKTKLMNAQKKTNMLQYKNQLAREKTKRLKKKVVHLQQVVQQLRSNKLLSHNAADILEKTYSGIPLALMKRLLSNSTRGKIDRSKYDETLRSFAMTLNFYSTKAYEYVRKTFNLALPSQRTIRGWYSNISCEPGFSQASFDSLKAKVAENKEKGRVTLCSLMFDEMHIKKEVETYNGKNWGYVNIGTNIIHSDTMPYAKEVFVLMVVAINASWKLPIAYFFIDGLTGEDRANIVKEALIKLDNCGVAITSISCDGPSTNFAMFNSLGADLNNLKKLKPYFLHPVNSSRIFAVFDSCHMMKLIRNNWASHRVFVDVDGGIVDFHYVEMLHKIQEEEGLRLGNKLRSAHMDWRKQKMKVNLAVQTLSESVASAIEFLMVDMRDIRFMDAKPTVDFIRLVDQLFDVLNSRTPISIQMKMPLSEYKEPIWKPFLEDAINYLTNLKLLDNRKLVETNIKTGFKGFAITAMSVMQLYKMYVKGENVLKYLLTYKLSTDHLELFFCSIRSRNGWNNNPTTVQFYHPYRRLLLHHDIKNMNGNCTSQDATNILFVTGNKKTQIPFEYTDAAIIKKYQLDEEGLEDVFHDHSYSLPITISLSEISENVIAYVAGYAVIMASKLIKCSTCIDALSVSSENNENKLKLLLRKKRGNLTIPSKDALYVCTEVEKQLRRSLILNNNKIPSEPSFLPNFIYSLHKKMITNVTLFSNIYLHNLSNLTLEENHLSRLIKSLCMSYYKIRMYNLAKAESYRIRGDLVRKTLNKTILFKNQ